MGASGAWITQAQESGREIDRKMGRFERSGGCLAAVPCFGYDTESSLERVYGSLRRSTVWGRGKYHDDIKTRLRAF